MAKRTDVEIGAAEWNREGTKWEDGMEVWGRVALPLDLGVRRP